MCSVLMRISCSNDVVRTAGKVFDSCWRADETIFRSEHLVGLFQVDVLAPQGKSVTYTLDVEWRISSGKSGDENALETHRACYMNKHPTWLRGAIFSPPLLSLCFLQPTVTISLGRRSCDLQSTRERRTRIRTMSSHIDRSITIHSVTTPARSRQYRWTS